MIPGGTPNPPLRRVVDAPFTSKSHFGLLAVRCLSYMGWGSPLFFFLKKRLINVVDNIFIDILFRNTLTAYRILRSTAHGE